MIDRSGLAGSRVSRRTVLRFAATAGSLSVLGLLGACGPSAPAAKPTEAPKAAAPTAAAAKPAAPAAPAPAASPAAAVNPTAAPAAAKPGGKMGGTARVALYSEAPTLDSLWTTAIIVVVPSQHVFEYLFAFDERWDSKPFLAEKLEIGNGGKSYTISLRKGIKFHNGKEMTAEDVIASLNRWGKVSGEGKLVYKVLNEISAPNPQTVKIDLKEPFAPMVVYLTGPNGGGALIMPKEQADKAGTERATEYIGTGPYKFVEHVPDRHIKVVRYDQYVPREEPPSAYAGRRTAYFDEILFTPVPDAAARIAGVETGNYQWAEEVTRDEYDRLKGSRDVDAIVVKPLRFQGVVFNKKQGPMANVKLRQAVQAALDHDEIMAAAFGPKDFWRIDQSLLPPESIWFSEAGKELFNKKDLDKAKALVKESGYNGEPVRWLGPADREDYFATAVTGVQQLKNIGINAEVASMDWGAVVKARTQPEQYEIFNTGFSFSPEPTQLSFVTAEWPGWWVNEEKEKQLAALNAETDQQKRKALWDKMQTLVYQEAPIIKVGEFFGLSIKRKELKGESIPISSWPAFWNQWVDK